MWETICQIEMDQCATMWMDETPTESSAWVKKLLQELHMLLVQVPRRLKLCLSTALLKDLFVNGCLIYPIQKELFHN